MATVRKAGLLLYCPATHGGIAEHAHYQARALHDLGVPVVMLASKDFLDGRHVPYPVCRLLSAAPTGGRRMARRIRYALWLVVAPWRLAAIVWRERPAAVLLASYSEYLSPLWIWPHLLLRRLLSISYGANLHDPVRNFQLGPRWWHLLSVRLAYRALDYVILHGARPRESFVPEGVSVLEAPVGIYDISTVQASDGPPADLRLPADARMLLCFGHIRDNKNIDLLIRAIADFGNVHLVVAGPAAPSGQRGADFYVDLAGKVGVRGRFHVIPRYIPDDEVAAYFKRAEWIAITYAGTFLSQSGVLNVAARVRKPVLASSGPSPMKSVLEKYRLGVFVEPDSLQALVGGLRELMDNPPKPDWCGYEAYASWDTNARVILSASGLSARQ